MPDLGCLLIHGFTGGPFEMQPLADHLQQCNYTTLCPTLSGHGTNKRELARTTWKDWLQSAEDNYLQLARRHSQIVVIGFSMGGLLAVNLAVKYPVSKLVTVSMPIYPLWFKQLARNVVADIKGGNYQHLRKYYANSSSTPLKAIINLFSLIRHTKPLLTSLQVPWLILQGLEDDTVHPKSALYIYQQAGSMQKYLKTLPFSGHQVFSSQEKKLVVDYISRFIAENGYAGKHF